MKKIYTIECTYIDNEVAPILAFYETEDLAQQMMERLKEHNEKSFSPLYKNFRVVWFPLFGE